MTDTTRNTVVVLMAIVGLVGSTILYAETTYFKVVDAVKIHQTIQKGNLNDLKREKYQFDKEKAKRPLTELELERYNEVEELIKDAQQELKK